MTQSHKVETELTNPPQTPQQKLEPQKAKAKPEVMPTEPEMIVIPLEEMETPPQTHQERKPST